MSDDSQSPQYKRSTSSTVPPRRNRRGQRPVVLRFCSNIAPNDGHPLAGVDPEVRNAQRQNVIAAILARLAGSEAGNSASEDTMKS